MEHSKLFEALALAPNLILRNRIVLAPMTTWASTNDGTSSEDRRTANEAAQLALVQW